MFNIIQYLYYNSSGKQRYTYAWVNSCCYHPQGHANAENWIQGVGNCYFNFIAGVWVGIKKFLKTEEEVQKKRKKLELENSNKNEPLFV